MGYAFNPVGVMSNFWEEQVAPGQARSMQVYVINDLESNWTGKVRLRLERAGKRVSEQSHACQVDGFGRQILEFKVVLPNEPGNYTIVAEVIGKGRPIGSARDFKVAAGNIR